MNPETLLVAHLREVDQVIDFVCKRHHVHDRDDFASWVMLKLVENDYAILSKFEERCSIKTFLSVVIHRLCLDYHNHLYGKWRPSTHARRLGDKAIALERMVNRDHKSLGEAVAELRFSGVDISESEAEALLDALPEKQQRPRTVAIDAVQILVEAAPDGDGFASAVDRSEIARHIQHVLRETIAAFEPQDRLIFRMRFLTGMTVAEIAARLRLEQKPLYVRVQKQLAEARRALLAAGITAADAERLIGATDLDLALDLPLLDTDGSGAAP